MKVTCLVMLLLFALLSLGCTPSVGYYVYQPSEPSAVATPLIVPKPASMPVPIGVPIKVNNDGIKVPGVPAYIEFFGVRDGSLLDTWTNDGYVDIGEARVVYERGSPLSIFVYNGYDEPVMFRIFYEDIPQNSAYCLATNKTYSKAPAQAWEWLKITEPRPLVGAQSVTPIPFSLSIPKGVEPPDYWEFRIHITPMSVGTVVSDASIRMLVSK